MSDKEDRIIHVQKQLDLERDEKVFLLDEKNKEEEEFITEKSHWQVEKAELKKQIQEMLEISKNDKQQRLSEVNTNEMNQAYRKAVKDKESLDNENLLLKQEVKRLQLIISNPHDLENNNNRHSMMYVNSNEEEGYFSSRNTLEKPLKKSGSPTSSQISEGDFLIRNRNLPRIQISKLSDDLFSEISFKVPIYYGKGNREMSNIWFCEFFFVIY